MHYRIFARERTFGHPRIHTSTNANSWHGHGIPITMGLGNFNLCEMGQKIIKCHPKGPIVCRLIVDTQQNEDGIWLKAAASVCTTTRGSNVCDSTHACTLSPVPCFPRLFASAVSIAGFLSSSPRSTLCGLSQQKTKGQWESALRNTFQQRLNAKEGGFPLTHPMGCES